jgi:ubiquinol-cytochrome c reductase cytochrome b subunit
VHVIFLPAALVMLVVAHVALMRRLGISGPVRPRAEPASSFYPYHALRDVAVVAAVLFALAVFAWRGAPPLERPADPTDAGYIPRPEWYFLGLFQLLKYFPGRWEVVGAIVLPTLLGAVLALLPWIDRSPSRDPRRRPLVMIGVVAGCLAIVALTALGWRDRPVSASARETWSLREIGGRGIAASAGCARCHVDSGVAEPLDSVASSRGPEWIGSHVSDPEMIAPGLRQPPTAVTEREVAAMVAYIGRLSRQPYPEVPPGTEVAAAVYARHCVGCHVVDGEGGSDGPDLSTIGRKHGVDELKRWIADPEAVNPDAEMPSFARRLTPDQLEAIAAYLAARK